MHRFLVTVLYSITKLLAYIGNNYFSTTTFWIGQRQNKSKAPWAAHGWIVQSQVYFCPCGKKSLCETIGKKICHQCTVIRIKIKWFSWFSWETFCASTRSANGNSDGRGQSLHTLFCFIRMLFFRPRLNILIFLPILEFIGVSIISVLYLDMYCVKLCMCSIAFCCSQC